MADLFFFYLLFIVQWTKKASCEKWICIQIWLHKNMKQQQWLTSMVSSHNVKLGKEKLTTLFQQRKKQVQAGRKPSELKLNAETELSSSSFHCLSFQKCGSIYFSDNSIQPYIFFNWMYSSTVKQTLLKESFMPSIHGENNIYGQQRYNIKNFTLT